MSPGADWKAGMDFTPPAAGAEVPAQQWRTRERPGVGIVMALQVISSKQSTAGGARVRGLNSTRAAPILSLRFLFPSKRHTAAQSVWSVSLWKNFARSAEAPGVKEGKTCPVCHGAGTETKLESFTVNIPKGVQDDSVIRVPGKGGAGIGGGARGDLYFRVHIQPDKRFRLRDGSDTELDLPLAPWEAVLGEYHKGPDAGWAGGTPYPSQAARAVKHFVCGVRDWPSKMVARAISMSGLKLSCLLNRPRRNWSYLSSWRLSRVLSRECRGIEVNHG